MPISDYSEHDGVALGQMVAKGEVTPLELVDAAIDRIERHNGALNAVVHSAYDEALELKPSNHVLLHKLLDVYTETKPWT